MASNHPGFDDPVVDQVHATTQQAAAVLNEIIEPFLGKKFRDRNFSEFMAGRNCKWSVFGGVHGFSIRTYDGESSKRAGVPDAFANAFIRAVEPLGIVQSMHRGNEQDPKRYSGLNVSGDSAASGYVLRLGGISANSPEGAERTLEWLKKNKNKIQKRFAAQLTAPQRQVTFENYCARFEERLSRTPLAPVWAERVARVAASFATLKP